MCSIQIQEMSTIVTAAATVFTALATLALAALTYVVWRATQMQFVASMTVAFQDEWHSPHASHVREYVHSPQLHDALDKAINLAYGKSIAYTNVSDLLNRNSLRGTRPDAARLKQFEDELKGTRVVPSSHGPASFTAFDALYEVLLSFDRIAVIRDAPLMMKRCILRYKPPIKALAPVLLAFIAVRRLLRTSETYKNDYIDMLVLLDKEDPKDPILNTSLVKMLNQR